MAAPRTKASFDERLRAVHQAILRAKLTIDPKMNLHQTTLSEALAAIEKIYVPEKGTE